MISAWWLFLIIPISFYSGFDLYAMLGVIREKENYEKTE